MNAIKYPIAIVLLCLASSAIHADDSDEKAEPKTHTIKTRWLKGYTYTNQIVEETNTSLRINFEDKPYLGGGVDTSKITQTYTPTTFDDEGLCTSLRVAFTKHDLSQTRLQPGENTSDVTYAGDGAFLGAEYQQDWKKNAWRRTLTKFATTAKFGEYPKQLKQLIQVSRKSRFHHLLPVEAMAVGDTWIPDVSEMESRVKNFGRQKDGKLELKPVCELTSIKDGIAIISFECTAKDLKPLKNIHAGSWSKETTIEVKLEATITINISDKYIVKEDTEVTATIKGKFYKNTQWLPAESTTKLTRVVETTRTESKS